jgi:hypothetical protein
MLAFLSANGCAGRAECEANGGYLALRHDIHAGAFRLDVPQEYVLTNESDQCRLQPTSECGYSLGNATVSFSGGQVIAIRLDVSRFGNEDFDRFPVPRTSEYDDNFRRWIQSVAGQAPTCRDSAEGVDVCVAVCHGCGENATNVRFSVYVEKDYRISQIEINVPDAL